MDSETGECTVKDGLKVYVWQDVLRDYSAGLVVIIAHNLDEAREVFMRDYPNEQYVLDNFFGAPHTVHTDPAAFYVYGGG
jgi:hypothetical protein